MLWLLPEGGRKEMENMARLTILWALLALAGGLLLALYLPGSGVWAQTPGGLGSQAIVPLYKLVETTTEAQDKFGWSVALEDNYLVVGASHYTGSNTGKGSVYVFERDANLGWKRVGKLNPEDGQEGDWFGYAVAISGDTIVVGHRVPM
jgi:hypothetical protein